MADKDKRKDAEGKEQHDHAHHHHDNNQAHHDAGSDAAQSSPGESDAKMQRLYLEAQILDQQMRMLQQQADHIEEQMAEFEALKSAIDEFKDVKPGSDVLVPFANGIFVKAKLADNDLFIINIGSQTAVEKDREGAKKLLDEQQANMQEAHIHFTKQLQQFSKRFQELEKELA